MRECKPQLLGDSAFCQDQARLGSRSVPADPRVQHGVGVAYLGAIVTWLCVQCVLECCVCVCIPVYMDLALPVVVIRYSARTSAAVPKLKTMADLGGMPPLVIYIYISADLTDSC